MKYFSLLLFSINLIMTVLGQNQKIDSLQKLLRDKKDTSTVRTLGNIGVVFALNNNKDSARLYFQTALKLAKELKFVRGEMEMSRFLGENLFRTGNYPQALKVSLDYVKLAEQMKDTFHLFWSMRNVMMTYEYLPNEFNKVIKYAEALKEIVRSGYFKDPWQVQHLELIGYVNHAIGYYQSTGQEDSVLYFSQRAYEIATGLKDDQDIALTTENLASVHEKLGNSDLALSYYKMSIEPTLRTDRFDNLSGIELSIANLYQQKGQTDSALLYIRQGLIHLKKNWDPATRADDYSSLSQLYKNYNRFDSSYKYLRLSVDLKDSLYNQQKANVIQTMVSEEQLRQQENEQKKIKDQEERKLNLQYVAMALGLIVFIILFLILSYSIIVNQNFIKFIGIVGLLVLFEFINLFIHPYLVNFTNHSPLLMLLIMVMIAALLVPAHHFLQKWISNRLVEKNKTIRLAAAKKTIAKLEQASEIIE